ncbi:MAG: M16 family metallopeptidase, partial [Candidatus Nanopelagicales bacterium]
MLKHELLEDSSTGSRVQKTLLPSGLRIITEEVPTVRSATIGYWVGIGSVDETPEVGGAAHFLEHLLFKGTSKRTALEISSEIEAVGGDMNAFTTQEYTCFHAKVLDNSVPLAVDVLSDMLADSKVTPEDTEQERNVVLEEISMHEDEPGELSYDRFSQKLLGDQPIGRPIIGTRETITNMTREQVNGFYQNFYSPQNTVISMAGNFKHEEAVDLVVKTLDKTRWNTKNEPKLIRDKSPLPANGKGVTLVSKDTEQAHLVWGMKALDRHHPDRFALAVLNAALGGGMSSRLFQEIREKHGLVYTVYSFAHQFTGVGMFGVYAGCMKERVGDVVGLIRQELNKVVQNGITEDELIRGKGQIQGGILLGLEDTNSRMTRIAKAELVMGEYQTVDQAIEKVNAVTLHQTQQLAEQIFTQD